MASLARSRMRHGDVLEFLQRNKAGVLAMQKYRKAHDEGFLDYAKMAVDFFRSTGGEDKAKPADVAAAPAAAGDAAAAGGVSATATAAAAETAKPPGAVQQYYMSQDLLRKMKWKKVTWDEHADFDGFSRRVTENEMFSSVKPFSHLSIHLVKDPNAVSHRETGAAGAQGKPLSTSVGDVTPGSLTDWYLSEPPAAPLKAGEEASLQVRDVGTFQKTKAARQMPFTVDWEAGEARLLDTASAVEIQAFLQTCAPRVMAIQQRMDDQQTTIAEDIENVRVRLGALSIKYNKHDKSFWDDKDRKEAPTEYANPANMLQFIESCKKRSTLLRRRGFAWQHIRVMPPNSPYLLDTAKQELQVPCNFEEYNYLPQHRRWEALERFQNRLRATKMVWFFVAMIFIGDFELL